MLGWLLIFEAIFFLIPLITALVYGEQAGFAFLLCIGICGALGGLCLIGKPKDDSLYAKEGFVIVALSWIVMSLFGALPFVFTGAIPNYIDALFETVSGFTTTGSSVIDSAVIEDMPRCILMWRSFTHWVGGMGVLVFMMALLPLSGGKNMHMMKAESPGPSVSKLVPKVRTTALILYFIYLIMKVIQFILLICGGMPVFDALNTAFATAGTGGFAFKADGFLGYSSYLQIVVTVFMVLFSINFNSYYLIGKGKWKDAFTAEVKTFLIIVVSAIAIVTLNVYFSGTITSFGDALKHAAFSVAAGISTTGFATEDFGAWPALSQTVLVMIMFVGACAGSTGGGMKVSRFIILFKGATLQMGKLLHPNLVKKITMDKKVVDDDVVQGVYTFVCAYIFIFAASLLIVCLNGFDLTTNFTAVAATINNIGPGLGMVGPAGNFAAFSPVSKIVFIFDMLVGRLEVFPMLVLFAPSTWKK